MAQSEPAIVVDREGERIAPPAVEDARARRVETGRVRITRRQVEHRDPQRVTVRREDAIVERVEPPEGRSPIGRGLRSRRGTPPTYFYPTGHVRKEGR